MLDDFKIYIVDDDPLFREVITNALTQCAHTISFESAESWLEYMSHSPSDILILDVGLPGLDGYSLCSYMKTTPELNHIPVIFVSSHDAISEHIKGYDVGGEDFIQKPFEPEELCKKIVSAQKRILDRRLLVQQLQDSELLSSLIMSNVDETAILLQFMSKLVAISNIEELAFSVLELIERFKLNGVVQIRTLEQSYTLSRSGINIPIEMSIIEHVRQQGRIFEFWKRGVHNFEYITLMINDLPVEDPEYQGRLRDHLSVAAQGVNSRAEAIIADTLNMQSQKGITSVLDKISHSTKMLDDSHKKHSRESAELIVTLQETLLNSFFKLGLSDAQEKFLQNMIGEFSVQMNNLFDDNQEITKILHDLNLELSKLQIK